MSEYLPASGEYYRIANVEFATFLEVSKAYDGASVSLRPKKPWVEKQQWTFVPGSTKDTYRIKSVPSVAEPPSLYLFADKTDVIVTADENEATEWTIQFKKNSKDCTIMFKDPASSRKHKFLYINDQCQKLGISASQDASFTANNADDVYKWNLVNVWHSLPKDNYRIRSIGGRAIYITTDNAIAVDTLQAPSSQAWALEPKPNGKCELKSANSKAYMTTTRSKDGYEIVKMNDEATVWQLRCVGDFAYSLSVTVDYFTVPLALTISEANNGVTLKPLKNARNQIWFFEPADVNSTVDPGPAPPPYEGQRYSEITNGGYDIYNTARSPYRRMYYTSGPWRWYNYDSSSILSAIARLTYVSADSPSFYLAMENNKDAYAAPSLASNTLVVDTTPHRWILEREVDPSGGYRYYIRSVTTQKVLSSDMVNDINGYPVFRCDTKSPGSTAQMWKLDRRSN